MTLAVTSALNVFMGVFRLGGELLFELALLSFEFEYRYYKAAHIPVEWTAPKVEDYHVQSRYVLPKAPLLK